MEVPQWGPGTSPGRGSPEAEAYVVFGAHKIAKFDNFVLFCAVALIIVSATSTLCQSYAAASPHPPKSTTECRGKRPAQHLYRIYGAPSHPHICKAGADVTLKSLPMKIPRLSDSGSHTRHQMQPLINVPDRMIIETNVLRLEGSASASRQPGVNFIDDCMLRNWHGNCGTN